ncbi:alpha/beta fold hydrolase [Actinoplanes sp. NPDC051346]|uniref:alpha/beta hydrolase n=1 Tax=Actinoplanes sp. NPDC051346 TaxID=3155048 RepID=UPI00342225D3
MSARLLLRRSALAIGLLLLAAGAATARHADAGLESRAVRVGGVPVELVRPAGAEPPGPAVVVAHGFAGSGRLMRPFADTLARRGYVVALPDLAGHGANIRPLTDDADVDRDLAAVVRSAGSGHGCRRRAGGRPRRPGPRLPRPRHAADRGADGPVPARGRRRGAVRDTLVAYGPGRRVDRRLARRDSPADHLSEPGAIGCTGDAVPGHSAPTSLLTELGADSRR